MVIDIDEFERQLDETCGHLLLQFDVGDDDAAASDVLETVQGRAVPRDLLDDSLDAFDAWNDWTAGELACHGTNGACKPNGGLHMASLESSHHVQRIGVVRVSEHFRKRSLSKLQAQRVSRLADLGFRQRPSFLLSVAIHEAMFDDASPAPASGVA